MLKKFLELSDLETTISLRQKELMELEEKIEEKKRLLKQLNRNVRRYEENSSPREVAVTKQTKPVSEKKVGEIARTDLVRALESGRVPQSVIERLCDKRYSKETLDLNFPILREVTDMSKVEELKKDPTGRSRYYAKPITIHGKQYLLCAQWFDYSKTKLIRWIEKYG
ncbi:hypothetical protein Q75_00360 [Bacillus coahuilensis p1.1.43]|uniref:Uncharacterized protein n=1 Tax=Bacillus coahuilensis p1.1.43 TaxID=1150625 RepID=A0A147KCL1_9BACI|nr:hypothetical protein [Bacillus coahuilensis]KUP09414.1 hypothetical protein Q75_00360 [Bacillus coahuilensis p1.1.43]